LIDIERPGAELKVKFNFPASSFRVDDPL